MNDEHRIQEIKDHWGRRGLSEAILSALTASGKSLDALTIDDLAPLDQFHGGGKRLTVRLAHLAGLKPGMHVLVYSGFHRLIRPGGLLAIQELMSGPNQPPNFPVMWSRDGTHHFLRTPEEMRMLIEAAGFRTLKWEDVTTEKGVPGAARPTHTIQRLVMGDKLLDEIMRAGQRNEAEKRMVMIQAVFDKSTPMGSLPSHLTFG